MVFALILHWLICRLFGRTYVASACGHKTKLVETVAVFGQKRIFRQSGKDPQYCCPCLARMAIRCGVCCNIILANHPIRLVLLPKSFPAFDGAVRYGEDFSVACLCCAGTVAERDGFWVPPGRVRLAKSLFQLLEENGHAAACNDIYDINQAVWLEE